MDGYHIRNGVTLVHEALECYGLEAMAGGKVWSAMYEYLKQPIPIGNACEFPEGKYLGVVKEFGNLGKGKRTNVGALIFDSAMSVRAQGWAGAPRGCNGDEDERTLIREEKLRWVVHAECNCIANAARAGIALDGCTMLVTHPPCMVCSTMIVQVGIKRVVAIAPDARYMANWGDDVARSRWLFAETDVKYFFINREE